MMIVSMVMKWNYWVKGQELFLMQQLNRAETFNGSITSSGKWADSSNSG